MCDWNYGEKFKSSDKILKSTVNRILQGFKMMDNKRLDGLAGYEVIFDYALKTEGIKKLFKKLPVFDSTAEYIVGLKSIQDH